ncbi:hypothetical protein AO242_04300 [Pseudomonas sp. ICMP 561]|nr:hypothetical protein AO242_04300 [Pseudomonas sp. ICMP 561]
MMDLPLNMALILGGERRMRQMLADSRFVRMDRLWFPPTISVNDTSARFTPFVRPLLMNPEINADSGR